MEGDSNCSNPLQEAKEIFLAKCNKVTSTKEKMTNLTHVQSCKILKEIIEDRFNFMLLSLKSKRSTCVIICYIRCISVRIVNGWSNQHIEE